MSDEQTSDDQVVIERNEDNDPRDGVIAELTQNLAVALDAVEAAEAKVAEFDPYTDIEGFLMVDAADVRTRFGKEKLRDLAMLELAEINKRRWKDGLDRVQYSPAEMEEKINDIISDLLADRKREAPPDDGSPIMRTLKMVDKDGNIRQVPFEPQVNNQAGSLEDGVARYRNKGWKLPKPMLCPSQNCWEPSAVDEDGRWRFKAYCTQDHLVRTEGANKGVEEALARR